MSSRQRAVCESVPTRSSAQLADQLRARISKGTLAGGSFLPSERELAREQKVSSKTARRALKLLESEALIVSESRRGYRVLSRANDPDRGCPIAMVIANPPESGDRSFYGSLLGALQDAAGRRGWSLLGVQREGRPIGEVVERLRAARACGAVVDSLDTELLEAVRRLGVPVVLADAWFADSPCDAVVQDGFAGGVLAAEWLAGRGHRRIAFLGPDPRGADMLVVERFSGAVGGLARSGLALDPGLTAVTRQGDPDAAARCARELLSRADRPTAVLALWQGFAREAARAARELGLAVGRDLDLVGWTTSPAPGAPEATGAAGPELSAEVVWSPADLAELCILRLMQRRADPRMPASLTRVPVRLEVRG